jgi:hypothetical protein
LKKERSDIALGFIKKWVWSMFLLYPSIIVFHQFWKALARNILMAVNYDYPSLISPFLVVLDFTTLLIHEAGHTIFGIFGFRFLGILGGTLMQLLIPTIILISGYWNRQTWLMQLSFFWLGFSCLDSAAYCADAKFQNLPLIGNLPKSAHDFTNLLNALDLLDYYREIAWIMFAIGAFCLLFGLILPILNIKKPTSIDLRADLEKVGLSS